MRMYVRMYVHMLSMFQSLSRGPNCLCIEIDQISADIQLYGDCSIE